MYICLHMQRKFLEEITEKYKMLVFSRERQWELWNKWKILVDMFCSLNLIFTIVYILCFHKNVIPFLKIFFWFPVQCFSLLICLLKVYTNIAWLQAKIPWDSHFQILLSML